MKRPSFNEKTEVKVITHDFKEYADGNDNDMYGWRGVVVAIRGLDKFHNEIPKPYSPDNYPEVWEVDASFKSPVDGIEHVTTFDDWQSQLGEYAEKCIAAETAKQARKIVIGG